MSGKPRIDVFKTVKGLSQRLRNDFEGVDFIVLYAHNGVGKTRLSMEFKEAGKRKKEVERDTLYFNAFTEDLFTWDNDLGSDSNRVLRLNADSRFFSGLKELEMDTRIRPFLSRYVDFDFVIDYEAWTVSFSREVRGRAKGGAESTETVSNIKVSRGEENLFVWCFFLAIAQLAIDGAEAYAWVKYLYIDDPISSLDDNNAIAVASDLAKLLRGTDGIKTVVSTHHSLFFNVMCNELKNTGSRKHKQYFLHKVSAADHHTLRTTDEAPFFHHVAMLSELRHAAESGRLYAYHFNMLRSIMEKTAVFFGYQKLEACLHGLEDEVLYARALHLLSHGKHSVYEPLEMVDDNKDLFKRILNAFLDRYDFNVPE